MNTQVGLIRAVLDGHLEAALVLADYLEEHGDGLPALLLRRRYARMVKKLAAISDATASAAQAPVNWRLRPGVLAELAKRRQHQEALLKAYVARKFIRESQGRITSRGGNP